jgi:hypothetical protein
MLTGVHHGPHAWTGRAVPRSVPREWCRHLLLLRRCASAELNWWGKSARFTVTHSLDGIIYALITGVTFGWL